MAQGDGWTTRVLAGAQAMGLEEGRSGLSDALRTAASNSGYGGAGAQEVIRLLKG